MARRNGVLRSRSATMPRCRKVRFRARARDLEGSSTVSEHSDLRRGYLFGNYRLFPNLRCLCRGTKLIHLSPTTLRVLIFLVEHRDKVVSREEFLVEIWFGSAIAENNLSIHVATLRKLLGADTIK